MLPVVSPDKARPRPLRWAVGLAAIALLAGACGKDAGEKRDAAAETETEESGLADAGQPVRGGRIVYGVEAETTGGFCLPEAQLGPAGNLIRNALYDTLTSLDENTDPQPFLAKSVSPDATFQTWTIGLRSGVSFHDGTTLDAAVVKNNLDAFVGRYPPRAGTLFPIVLANIDTVTVANPLTVVITTKTPWPALPSYLATLGIMGQSQLDDKDDCDSQMVGTGPFKLATWTQGQELLAQRNDDYWQIAPDGEPYPYADAIAFRPIPDGQQAMNALESGEINAFATDASGIIHGTMTDLRESGDINLLVSDDHAEVEYLLLNNGKAPFDDERMRRAVATGVDRETLNELSGDVATIADQPFPEGDMGYVEGLEFPEFDPEAAKALVAEYVADGGNASITLTASQDPAQLAQTGIIQNMLGEIGISVKVRTSDQATVINEVLAGNFEVSMWRQHAGGDADYQRNWWYGATPNPTNFSRINDPVINEALEEGRSEIDPDKRRAIYERIAPRFAEKVFSVWLTYSEWGIGLGKDVHGIFSAELPDDGGPVFTGLAAGHPVHGMWIGN